MPPSTSSTSKSTSLPKNWPPHLPYLTTQTISPTLTPTHLLALRTKPTGTETIVLPSNTSRGPCSLVKITPISTTSTHPAAGQSGLFASRDLKPGTFILRYLGVVHASPPQVNEGNSDAGVEREDPHGSSDYDLSLDRHHGIGIDADKMGNEARFINDYRGVPGREGRKANAEFRECWDEGRGERGMGVWVLGGKEKEKGLGKANKSSGSGKMKGDGGKGGIKKGEEILVSYGRGFWGARREEVVDEWEVGPECENGQT